MGSKRKADETEIDDAINSVQLPKGWYQKLEESDPEAVVLIVRKLADNPNLASSFQNRQSSVILRYKMEGPCCQFRSKLQSSLT